MNFAFYHGSRDSDYASARCLRADDVHIWQIPLDIESPEISEMVSLLTADENARAARFRGEKLRSNFILGRATLRKLLGSFLGVPAAALSFTYNAAGKPSLTGLPDAPSISFNVSHSGEIMLFAFTRNRQIGVDVELVRKDFNVEEISERFFSPAERQVLRNLPAEERYEAFFRCWTRKEAYIKATGEGLSHPLHLFDVSLAPEEDNALLATRPAPSDAGRWLLRSLPTASGYVAALAVGTGSASLISSHPSALDGAR